MPEQNGRSASEQGSAQISEDVRFQERTWTVQRVGWLVMALLLAAALAGVFAKGPLSRAEARDDPGVLRVEYERFQRLRAPSSLRLYVAAEASSSDTFTLQINRTLAEMIEPHKIMPEPRDTKLMPTGVEYTFAMVDVGKPAAVRLILNPDEFGVSRAEIGVSGRAPARFNVFIYP